MITSSNPSETIRSASSITTYVHCPSTLRFVSPGDVRRANAQDRALETVLETTWRGDDDLRSVAHVELLLLDRTTSDDGYALVPEQLGELVRLRLDLLGEFSGRREYERVGTPVAVLLR